MNWLWLLVACGESGTPGTTTEQELGLLSLASVSPSEISATGGERVVLDGAGFEEDSIVRVNGVDCASTFFASVRQLACVTPSAAVGEGTISVLRVSDQQTVERPISVVEAVQGDGENDTSEPMEDTGITTGEDDTAEDQPVVVVEYCQLQWPCSMELETSQTSEEVYGRVYTAGVTDRAGAGENVQVSLGVGAPDADPSSDWTWSECVYNADADGLSSGDMANDEFMGTFQAPDAAGTYRYTVRARIGDGPWTLCDFGSSCGGEGTADGFDINATGELTVSSP